MIEIVLLARFDCKAPAESCWTSPINLNMHILGQSNMYTHICNIIYCISSINAASSISTPVRYYSSTNNIKMVVIFISNAPLNSTACHFATLDIIAKHCVTMAVSSIGF